MSEENRHLGFVPLMPDVTAMMVRRMAATRNDYLRTAMAALRQAGVAPYRARGDGFDLPKERGKPDKSRFFDPQKRAKLFQNKPKKGLK